ncbi:hypothetical protein EVG20_g9495 [Dentipellis fragilis]|uniref:3-beta hydroxysteroid dehydrogenase/isomerase domain-containing protein n=1 Tax=Dentipellis fragilis TaxID=205917 RepID=A0A4Y9XZR4_9AGAM|nr:hypothetical protein EVG20_g9495 [Dentipellis fragilis]
MGAPLEDFKPRSITKIPRWWALCMATATEAWCTVTGGTTEFTRFSIRYLTTTQWYNIEKARNVLGYEPRVTLEESVHLATKWWKERGEREYLEKPTATPFKKA